MFWELWVLWGMNRAAARDGKGKIERSGHVCLEPKSLDFDSRALQLREQSLNR